MARYWVAAVALLLTGCTTVVTGGASPRPAELRQYQEDHAPLTSQRALGDVTTLDYCSLLDLKGVEQAGATGVGPASPSFNYCRADASYLGEKLEVGVGYLDSQVNDGSRYPDPSKQLKRGLTAQRDISNDYQSCARHLKLADGVSLQAYVDDLSDQPRTDGARYLCDIDGAVFDGLVAAITNKKVAHLTFPPGSLGTVDACTLVPDAQVSAQLGTTTQRTPVIPTKHRCRWQDRSSGDSLGILFEVDRPLGPATESLGGHQATISGFGQNCLASTTVGPYPGAKDGEYQLAEVYVALRHTAKDPCGMVRTIATAAWPHLPPA
jgi:hypothetical protein